MSDRSMTGVQATAEELGAIKFDADGLVPTIAQDVDGTVLMLAWMNADTLRMTFSKRRMVYWSRSRQEVWEKGATSGDWQEVVAAHYDCDGDVLLFTVVQHGRGACHTGARSCFARRFGGTSADPAE